MTDNRRKTGPTPSRTAARAAARTPLGWPYTVTGSYMARHLLAVESNRGGGRARAAARYADVPRVTVLRHEPVAGERAARKAERAERRAARRAGGRS